MKFPETKKYFSKNIFSLFLNQRSNAPRKEALESLKEIVTLLVR